ncbi:MAG: hypothetical protein ACI9X8_002511, partial [Pseudoalteromonas distincta]
LDLFTVRTKIEQNHVKPHENPSKMMLFYALIYYLIQISLLCLI